MSLNSHWTIRIYTKITGQPFSMFVFYYLYYKWFIIYMRSTKCFIIPRNYYVLLIVWCFTCMQPCVLIVWCFTCMQPCVLIVWCFTCMQPCVLIVWCFTCMQPCVLIMWCFTCSYVFLLWDVSRAAMCSRVLHAPGCVLGLFYVCFISFHLF